MQNVHESSLLIEHLEVFVCLVFSIQPNAPALCLRNESGTCYRLTLASNAEPTQCISLVKCLMCTHATYGVSELLPWQSELAAAIHTKLKQTKS